MSFTVRCHLVYMNCFSCQCRCNTVLATWVTQSTLLEAIHQRDTAGCNAMFLFLSCMSVISSAMCLSVNSTMPDDAYTCSRANLSLLQVFACRKAINLYSDYWYSPKGDFTEFAPQDIIHRFMHLTRVFVQIHCQLPWRITGAFTAVFFIICVFAIQIWNIQFRWVLSPPYMHYHWLCRWRYMDVFYCQCRYKPV